MSHGPVDGGHDKYEILYQPYINSLQIGVLCDLIFNALNDLTDDIMKRCFFSSEPRTKTETKRIVSVEFEWLCLFYCLRRNLQIRVQETACAVTHHEDIIP